MTNNDAVTREAVQKMAGSMRTVFFLCLLTNIYDLYRFGNAHGEIQRAIGTALSILITGLVWQLSRQLRAEKKQALHYWLAIVLLAYTRWIFVEGTFSLNLFSMTLLVLAVALTVRMVTWARNGMLV